MRVFPPPPIQPTPFPTPALTRNPPQTQPTTQVGATVGLMGHFAGLFSYMGYGLYYIGPFLRLFGMGWGRLIWVGGMRGKEME